MLLQQYLKATDMHPYAYSFALVIRTMVGCIKVVGHTFGQRSVKIAILSASSMWEVIIAR